jgi:predicted DNA-binding antitoxin AbrB/MazE fold protein
MINERIAVVYEHGVLRPIEPLRLPEHTRLEIQLIAPTQLVTKADVRQILQEAGVIGERPSLVSGKLVSEEELLAAARELNINGLLSEWILRERDEE